MRLLLKLILNFLISICCLNFAGSLRTFLQENESYDFWSVSETMFEGINITPFMFLFKLLLEETVLILNEAFSHLCQIIIGREKNFYNI